jgi:hypothetical protein
LSNFEAERVHIGDKYKKAGEFLAAGDNPELRRLPDRIDGSPPALASPITLAFETFA